MNFVAVFCPLLCHFQKKEYFGKKLLLVFFRDGHQQCYRVKTTRFGEKVKHKLERNIYTQSLKTAHPIGTSYAKYRIIIFRYLFVGPCFECF